MKQWFVSLAAPLLVLVGLVSAAGGAQAAEIEDARIWPAPDNTRLVFDLSGPVEHRVFVLSNPSRVVVDISDVSLDTNLESLSLENSGVSRIRSAQREGGELRVVLDLSTQLSPRSFVLRPNEQYGHRLVLDLERPPGLSMEPSERQVSRSADDLSNQQRNIVVAIDAGHGGEDPGAIGPRGTREKRRGAGHCAGALQPAGRSAGL